MPLHRLIYTVKLSKLCSCYCKGLVINSQFDIRALHWRIKFEKLWQKIVETWKVKENLVVLPSIVLRDPRRVSWGREKCPWVSEDGQAWLLKLLWTWLSCICCGLNFLLVWNECIFLCLRFITIICNKGN